MEDDQTLESDGPAPASTVAPGGHIGKYEMLRVLGTGGMGVVWAARDPDLDRKVALKLLRAERASPELRTRLLREARAMARLKHPNVITVYEVASDAGRDFIAMELVDGKSLDQWLRDKPAPGDVWDALLAAGHGLAAAHAAGLVHRDFKPHNVLRSRDGRVLVTDFGLARGTFELEDTAVPGAGDSVLDVRLTATGQLLGTPAYMAPEQFDGETDARTDQFSFCVTAWEALCGARPYTGTTIAQLREAARSGAAARNAKLPPGVRAVLQRGLAPDPAKRWPDMKALLAALGRTRRTWPRRLAVIAPLVVVAGGLVAVLALRGHPAETPPCEPARMLGSVWTPQQRADVLTKHPELASIAPRIDTFRASWLLQAHTACQKGVDRDVFLACYGEQRDELALFVDLLQRYRDGFVGRRDLLDLLGRPDACREHPVSRPPLPRDARREPILAFLAKAYRALDKPGGTAASFDALRAEAAAIKWPPLEARLEEMIAYTAARSANTTIAQPAYRRAADLAHATDDRVTEARARVGILELGAGEIENTVLPSAAYESELRDAQAAVRETGDDYRLAAVLEYLRAKHAAYVEGDLTKAIDLIFPTIVDLLASDDVSDLTKLVPTLAELFCVRAQPNGVRDATQILAQVDRILRREGFVADTAFLRDAQYWAAWLRGDIAAAHAALDQVPAEPAGKRTTISGRVVDAQGHPVAGARVVAWIGDMYGDRERVFTAPTGAVATSSADGRFECQAPDESAVIAERGDQRSMPVLAKPGVELVLGPTRSITGRVDASGEPTMGIEPYARIEVALGRTWYDSVAPAADGTFTVAGIPAAATHVQLGAVGSHWPHDPFRRVDTDGTTVHWPIGDTIDVLVPSGAQSVWLFRGRVAPTSLRELMDLAENARDVLHTAPIPVGWANATRAGLPAYPAGSKHAVFHDVAAGTVTACNVGPFVRCKTTTADAHAAPVRDGRHWPDGTVIGF